MTKQTKMSIEKAGKVQEFGSVSYCWNVNEYMLWKYLGIFLLLSILLTLLFMFPTPELTLETHILVGNMSRFELVLKINVRKPDDGYL